MESVEDEIERYQSAKVLAGEQLSSLYEKALKEVGEANAAIFEIHQMMLEDDDYNDSGYSGALPDFCSIKRIL